MSERRIGNLAVGIVLAALIGAGAPALAQAPVPGQQPAEKARQAADMNKKQAKKGQKKAKKAADKGEARARPPKAGN
jgi:hypothetical protein